MTAKEPSLTIILCEIDHQSTECYCVKIKEIKESQKEVKGGLEQLQQPCLECPNRAYTRSA